MRAKTVDYLVIGAGIAGLGCAYELQTNRKEVLVLEKESFPGGRMSTKIFDGIPCDLGAQFIASFYKNIPNLAKEFHINTFDLHVPSLSIKKNNHYYSFNPSRPFSFFTLKILSLQVKIKFILTSFAQIIKYKNTDLYHFRSLIESDKESVKDFFEKSCGKEMTDNFINPGMYGFFFHDASYFSQILFAHTFIRATRSKYFSFTDGIGALSKKLSQQVSVQYNSFILSVKRTKEKVEVTKKSSKNNSISKIFAKKVIIAVPGNAVLKMVDKPTQSEKAFFSQITYASTLIIHCKAKTDFFVDKYVVWFSPVEESCIAALHLNPYTTDREYTYFIIALQDEYAKKLLSNNKVDQELIKDMVKKEFPTFKNLEILTIASWKSAIPMFKPGHIRRICEFLDATKNEKQIFYCGDYIGGPYTEGALTSGLNVARKLLI